MTDFQHGRDENDDAATIQDQSRAWWSTNPMAYDWESSIEAARFSSAWFEAIDRRFLYGARLFGTEHSPFDRIIPVDQLKGKRVLEIGCGMGLQAETMARAGAHLTCINISPTSIEATAKRFELRGLKANLICGDAETMPFDSKSFDFVWSWGVIHHSARTARIVRQIARVLADDGQTRVMVSNREGMPAKITWLKDYILRGQFVSRTFDEVLWQQSDGFSARFYPREQFADLFRGFFETVSVDVYGQDVDIVPLPRKLRERVVRFIPDQRLAKAQSWWGAFLFLTADNPIR
ncbi:MAG: class I SAM-dependent methyltransferase [Myxococcota bacterium]